MKTLLLGITLLGSLHSFANDTELEKKVILTNAEHLIESEVYIRGGYDEYKALELLTFIFAESDSYFNHDLPESGEEFYLACSYHSLQSIIGYEAGRCVSYSLTHNGIVNYIPASLFGVRIGAAAGADIDPIDAPSIQRVKDASSLLDVASFSITGNSGGGFIGSLGMNWFTIRSDKTASTFDGDAKLAATLRGNIINFDFSKISIDDESYINGFKLPRVIMNNLADK